MYCKIFESEYVIVQYDETSEICMSTYLTATGEMFDDDWKKLMHNLLDVVKKYKPKYIIDNSQRRKYAYPPEIQEWTIDLFSTTFEEIGLKKYIQVLLQNLVASLSGYQLLQLSKADRKMSVQSCFKKNLADAEAWIIQ